MQSWRALPELAIECGSPIARAFRERDCSTLPGSGRTGFLREIQIEPPQIGSFKVELHRAFLAEWLAERRDLPDLDLEALWSIREECIAALTQ